MRNSGDGRSSNILLYTGAGYSVDEPSWNCQCILYNLKNKLFIVVFEHCHYSLNECVNIKTDDLWIEM